MVLPLVPLPWMRKILLFVSPLLNIKSVTSALEIDSYFAYKNTRFDGDNEIDCNFAAVLG